jgi:hypothetical protein
MVKLPPEEQARFIATDPAAFLPANGAWGRQGCTLVRLPLVLKSHLQQGLESAWKAAASASRPRRQAD